MLLIEIGSGGQGPAHQGEVGHLSAFSKIRR